MTESIAVVVPAYNEPPKAIDRTLRSALRQTTAVEQVVLVDDDSPRPLTIAHDLRTRVDMIRMPYNAGISAARNRAAEGTRADMLLFVNCDVVLAPEWAERAAAFMRDDPRVGAVGGKIVPRAGSPRLRAWRLQHIEPKVHRVSTSPARVGWLVGHTMMFRRSVFDHIGGFDESLRHYGEDADITERMIAADWDAWFLPQCVAESHENTTVDLLARKMIRNSGWSLTPASTPRRSRRPSWAGLYRRYLSLRSR